MNFKERILDAAGIAGISVLTLIGMYFSLFAQSSFTGAGFVFGIVYFFFYKVITRKSYAEMQFDIRTVGKWLKRPVIWLWVLLPAVLNLLQTAVAYAVSRSYYNDVVRDEFTRIGSLVPESMTQNFLALIPVLIILAMGEEICFRAFFQGRLSRYLPAGPSIVLSSLVFTAGHVYREPPSVMIFWVLNTFVLSLLFGVIQKKTENAYVSTIAHFLSNYLAFILIFSLR